MLLMFDALVKILAAVVGSEARSHPVFVLLTFTLGCIGSGAALVAWAGPFVKEEVYQAKVTKIEGQLVTVQEQLDKFDKSLCGVGYKVEKSSYQQQLRTLDTDIYNLENEINAGSGTDEDRRRLYRLKRDRDALEKELDAMEKCRG